MNKWLYIKSDNKADAFALASVLLTSTDKFNMVRKSNYTHLFVEHSQIETIGFPHTEDTICYFEPIESDNFQTKCKQIAEILKLSITENYSPYIPNEDIFDLPKWILDKKCIVLNLLFFHENHIVDIMQIDALVSNLFNYNITTVSAGEMNIPHIRKTVDLRGIPIFHLLKLLKGKISIVITNENSWVTICDSLNIPTIFLQDSCCDCLSNEDSLKKANELTNKILRIIN